MVSKREIERKKRLSKPRYESSPIALFSVRHLSTLLTSSGVLLPA